MTPGQINASVLFILYSAVIGNAVFIASNLLMLATAITCDGLQPIKRWRLDRADAQAR
ncbi:hypothetical protein [Xanthomonas fragariae]|uniref:hypothetical protein n=1 Tax=Xanthomonas fragariae TaxID=48664 RepID=UPI001ABEBF34|nr:hypothetical protein [Xanthomonas fragariae]UKR54294.1 hypothetical protein K4A87_08880 [Xanthomonas fragariae]